VKTSDLSTREQAHVRASLRFLRTRCGGWSPLAKALRFGDATIARVIGGRKNVSASMAVRIARFAAVGVDDVLEGRFPPPGTCPHCGHRAEVES
jgi:plasmid maintenance system antidote protein VapI